jgi:hypothetical protein
MAECQRRRHKRVVEGAGRYDWSPAVGAARHSGRPRVMPPPPNTVDRSWTYTKAVAATGLALGWHHGF